MDYKEKYNTIIERARTVYERACNDEGKDLIEYLFDGVEELKESEDERIRKTLLRCCDDWDKGQFGCMAKEDVHAIRAYLERQKDSDKAMSAIEKIDEYIDSHTANAHDMDDSNPDKKYYSGVDDTLSDIAGILTDSYTNFDVDAAFDAREPRDNWEYIKEFCDKFGRIPKDMDELDTLVSYVMNKKQKEQKNYRKLYEDIAKSEWFKKAYEGKSLGCDYEQKEQKPTELSEEDEKWFKEIELMALYFSNNTNYREKFFNWLNSLHERFNSQSKQEWSEDDETRLKVIKEELERFIMLNQYGTPLSVDDIDWLKSLPERFNLQPKQEQSKDKTTLECSDSFKRFIDMVHSVDKGEFTEFEYSIINFVLACCDKNIMMTPKGVHCYAKTILNIAKEELSSKICAWTDEEEIVLHNACEFIRHRLNDNECRNGNIGGMDYKVLYEKLKSLCFRYRLKPSEEQKPVVYKNDFDSEAGTADDLDLWP